MKKLIVVVIATIAALSLLVMPAVAAAGNGGAEVFMSGGGSLKDGKKPAYTFAGNVGLDAEGNIIGQFQINDHVGKETWHCHGNFSDIDFSGDAIEGPTGPSADFNTVSFTGEFTSNRGNTATLYITIVDVDEPGIGNDVIVVDYAGSGTWFIADPISTGNFQAHGMEVPDEPNDPNVY